MKERWIPVRILDANFYEGHFVQEVDGVTVVALQTAKARLTGDGRAIIDSCPVCGGIHLTAAREGTRHCGPNACHHNVYLESLPNGRPYHWGDQGPDFYRPELPYAERPTSPVEVE
jgi:hypothetical protein